MNEIVRRCRFHHNRKSPCFIGSLRNRETLVIGNGIGHPYKRGCAKSNYEIEHAAATETNKCRRCPTTQAKMLLHIHYRISIVGAICVVITKTFNFHTGNKGYEREKYQDKRP